MSDEVPVLVGHAGLWSCSTKLPVRAVIHLSLPKSVEQYYQEARTRRTRWQPSIAFCCGRTRCWLLAYFIDQVTDPAEKQRAWQRYHEICGYVQSGTCRHRQICLHFGENTQVGFVRCL